MPLWSFSDAVAGVGPDHGRAGPDANLAGGGGAATDNRRTAEAGENRWLMAPKWFFALTGGAPG